MKKSPKLSKKLVAIKPLHERMEPIQISSEKVTAIAGTLKSCISLAATIPVTPLFMHSSTETQILLL